MQLGQRFLGFYIFYFFLGVIKLRVRFHQGREYKLRVESSIGAFGRNICRRGIYFVSNIGGVYGYLEQAMDIRTAVADGHGLNPVDMGAPCISPYSESQHINILVCAISQHNLYNAAI